MKITFASPLRVEKLDQHRWILLEPFVVISDSNGLREDLAPVVFTERGFELTIPKGFETDFASVPRLPFAYWLTGGLGDRAAVLHDFLYSVGAGRKWADLMFRAALEAEGVSAWRRQLMYLGVRLGGGTYYGERAELEAPAGE